MRVGNAIAITRRQVAQLTRLVDDLLDVSRVTQGRIGMAEAVMLLASRSAKPERYGV